MSLAPQVIGLVKYVPEVVAEAQPFNLVANTATRVVDLPYGGTEYDYLLRLREIGAVRNANVSYVAISGVLLGRRYARRINGNVLPLVDYNYPIEVPLDEQLFVDVFPTANIGNYQSRVLYEVRDFSVAEKIALGATEAALTSEELELAERFNLENKVKRGELPLDRPLGTLVRQEVHSYYGALVANTPVNVGVINVAKGEKAILRRLWALRPAANVTALTITVEREKADFLRLYPHVMTDLNTVIRPMELYIPALTRNRCYVTSTVGHVAADVGVVAEFDIRKLTVWDKVAWGLTRSKLYTSDEERAMIKDLELEDLVRAGIYSLPEAWLHSHT